MAKSGSIPLGWCVIRDERVLSATIGGKMPHKQGLDRVISVELLKSIPQQPQVQCSTADQLVALQVLANKFGLYDAADVVQQHIGKITWFPDKT
jgi:hypothetical protein